MPYTFVFSFINQFYYFASIFFNVKTTSIYTCYFKNEKKSAKELMSDAVYVSHRRLIPYALEIVQKNKSHLAIVVDNIKDKHFLGIITLEDILEELVGEIYDEDDIGGADDE